MSDDPQRRPSVLVVDDEPDVLEVTRLSLAALEIDGLPLEVRCVSSSAAARDALEARSFDLAIVDVSMESERAGLHLLHWIRERPELRLIPIIVRTGQSHLGPPEDLLARYDIVDVWPKAEVSALRLTTAVIGHIRHRRHTEALVARARAVGRGLEDAQRRARRAPQTSRAIDCLIGPLAELGDGPTAVWVLSRRADAPEASWSRRRNMIASIAEPDLVQRREALLAEAERQGFVSDARGAAWCERLSLVSGPTQWALVVVPFKSEPLPRAVVALAGELFVLAIQEAIGGEDRARLLHLAWTEPVSGALNHRGLHDALERFDPGASTNVLLLAEVEWRNGPDREGEGRAADEAVRELCTRLRNRPEIVAVARLADTRLAVLATVPPSARRRLVEAVESCVRAPIPGDRVPRRLSVHLGAACGPAPHLAELWWRAERALRRSLEPGHGPRVVWYGAYTNGHAPPEPQAPDDVSLVLEPLFGADGARVGVVAHVVSLRPHVRTTTSLSWLIRRIVAPQSSPVPNGGLLLLRVPPGLAADDPELRSTLAEAPESLVLWLGPSYPGHALLHLREQGARLFLDWDPDDPLPRRGEGVACTARALPRVLAAPAEPVLMWHTVFVYGVETEAERAAAIALRARLLAGPLLGPALPASAVGQDADSSRPEPEPDHAQRRDEPHPAEVGT
jgi:CheY-like chemotaxis protein/GGDEF domain-containing protein